MSKLHNQDFASAPIWPLMIKMAIPSVIAQLINLLYNIVDRIYIGHIAGIGVSALAGVGVCSTLIILISSFANLAGAGGCPLSAISMGKGDMPRAELIIGNSLFLAILFSLLLVIPSYLFLEPILKLTGASSTTLPYAKEYMSIYLLGSFFVMVSIGLNPYINAQGKPMIAMCSVILGAVLNIILDPLFIFVFDMGVRGAALATVISQFASAVWILGFLTSKKAVLRIKLPNLKLSSSVLFPMLALGVSPFVMSITESLVGFVLNNGLSRYGDIYVSALTVLQSSMQFVSVPLQGFATGCVPVISYNFGRGCKERVKAAYKVLLTCLFSYNLVVTLLCILFPGVVASIFTSDPELITVVKRVMPIFLAGMPIFGLQRSCQNTFVALNEPKISLFIAVLRKVILLVPLALLLPHLFGLGVTGIFAAESVADFLSATLCTLLFVWRFPKILKSMDKPANKEALS